MIEVAISIFVLAGAAFMLVAALGVARFPDVLSRMHAASKATTFGLSCLLLAMALSFRTVEVAVKAAGIVLLIFLTVPAASQLMARAIVRSANGRERE